MRALTLVSLGANTFGLGACADSPDRVLAEFRDAVRSGGVEMLERHIDFESLRKHLRADLHARMAEEVTNEPDGNPFADLGMALAVPLVNCMVESLITPEALVAGLGQNDDQSGKYTANWEDYTIERMTATGSTSGSTSSSRMAAVWRASRSAGTTAYSGSTG